MDLVKKILKYLGFVLLIPATYFTVGVLCSYIPVNPESINAEKNKQVFLATNGVHLEIILSKTEMDSLLLDGLKHSGQTQFLSFGWGEKTYYTKAASSVPFTNINRFQAALLNTPSLLHVTRYTSIQQHWVEIKTTSTQFVKLQNYISESFKKDPNNHKTIIPEMSYGANDNFYEAIGNYHCLNTCNTWVNTAFKKSELKACLWTPFDFGLLSIYKN